MNTLNDTLPSKWPRSVTFTTAVLIGLQQWPGFSTIYNVLFNPELLVRVRIRLRVGVQVKIIVQASGQRLGLAGGLGSGASPLDYDCA
jgi:hypothetical protein